MKPMRSRKPGGGEVLIVVAVVVGFFWLISEDKFVVEDIWSYLGFLGVIVLFYFALLLCRMIFFYMLGGNYSYPWWEMVNDKKLEELKKLGKKKQ